MQSVIWVYWEGPMPQYIRLCHETVLAHNDNVKLLDRDSFERLFQYERDIDIDRLAINHKSDFIRAYLLFHYGGLYVDSDCVVLQDLSRVLEMARETGFVGYREPQGYMSCNFMASREGGEVITEHFQRVCKLLRSEGPLEWLDLASIPMDLAIAEHPGKSIILPTESVMPVGWHESEKLVVERDDDEHQKCFNPDAFCYMLSNQTIKSREETQSLCQMDRGQLLGGHMFLSFVLRKALAAHSRSTF